MSPNPPFIPDTAPLEAPDAAPTAGRRRATVGIGFVRGLLAGPNWRGYDRAQLLRKAGIGAELLHDDRARIPIEDYAALYNCVVTAMGDEGFGLFSRPLRPGCFEFLCRGVVSARTLEEALKRASRFFEMVLPDLAIEVRRHGGEAQLIVREPRDILPLPPEARVFALEWLLRLLHALACWLVGRGIALDAVEFPFPRPPHAADYALIYTEHSGFEATAVCAHFAGNLLDLPVRRDEAALERFLEGAPGKITSLYRRDREMVLRVRDVLRNALPESPALEAVADRLHLSARTLHRRLEEEGASFRTIKDALRRDIALARLTKTRQPIARIALDLGYTEPSAFYRAFVSWTGVPPTHYRNAQKRSQG